MTAMTARLIVASVMLLTVALAGLMPTAFASSLRACGDYLSYTSLREKGTTCARARKVAKAEYNYPHGLGSSHVVAGFRCQATFGPSAIHHRCVRGSAIVKFDEQ